MRPHTDYALARRAVLRDLRRGRLAERDVCDAHPELLRAGRNVGECAGHECPVCGGAGVRLVSYVYGDRLGVANGRALADPGELDRLDAAHEEFARYVVEVCVDCRWNHLARRELYGRRHASEARSTGARARTSTTRGESRATVARRVRR